MSDLIQMPGNVQAEEVTMVSPEQLEAAANFVSELEGSRDFYDGRLDLINSGELPARQDAYQDALAVTEAQRELNQARLDSARQVMSLLGLAAPEEENH